MKVRLLALAASLATASSLSAAVLVSFDMSTITGSGSGRSVSTSFVETGITSTGLLKNGSNMLSSSPVNTVLYGGNASSSWGTAVAQPTLDVGVTLSNANYFYFTVTPQEGQSITIDSISLGAAASGTNLRSFYLLSNVTGYSTVLLSDSTDAGLVRRSGGALKSYGLVLTDPAFTNITTATTFRFYLQTAQVNQELDFDNITLNGSVSAVPEPSTYAMGAAVLVLGFAAWRRRR